eukprot:456811_1
MKAIVALILGDATAWNYVYILDDVKEMDHLSTFKAWADSFGRQYADIVDESSHFMVWLDNIYTIGYTNKQGLSYKLCLNQFSDMTGDQFKHNIHGDKGS